jgi:hypothetical protein
MGKLLSSAIKMQNSIVNPTLIVEWFEFSLGGAVNVYKNGSYYGSPTAGTPYNVSIVAGDTFYLEIIPPFEGIANYAFYENEAYVIGDFAFSPETLTTDTFTAIGTNAYGFVCGTGII